MKFEKYLEHPLNINQDYTITQIIKSVINNKYNKINSNEESENDELINNYINTPMSDRPIIKKKIKNENSKNNIPLKENLSFPQLNFSFNKNEEKYYINVDKNNLKLFIKNIEEELVKIKIENNKNKEKNNKDIYKNDYSFKSFNDNNKYVPNLCLSAKGFSEKYKHNIIKYNNKIKNLLSKKEKIKNINNRMYYDYMKKKNGINLELSNIRKNLKLTEYIVMKRVKDKLFIQNIKDIKDKFSEAKII